MEIMKKKFTIPYTRSVMEKVLVAAQQVRLFRNVF